MHCPNCGQSVDGRFCRNCGADTMPPAVEQTIRADFAHGMLGIAFVAGFILGAGGWLFLLYDASVQEQSLLWFLGALPSGIIAAYLARWAVVALLTR